MRNIEEEIRALYRRRREREAQFLDDVEALVPVGSTIRYHHASRQVDAVVLGHLRTSGRVAIQDLKTGAHIALAPYRIEEVQE